MNPTNKLRFVIRNHWGTFSNPNGYGYGQGGTAMIDYHTHVPVQVLVLQQWWESYDDKGTYGEWRDVPVEVEQ